MAIKPIKITAADDDSEKRQTEQLRDNLKNAKDPNQKLAIKKQINQKEGQKLNKEQQEQNTEKSVTEVMSSVAKRIRATMTKASEGTETDPTEVKLEKEGVSTTKDVKPQVEDREEPDAVKPQTTLARIANRIKGK